MKKYFYPILLFLVLNACKEKEVQLFNGTDLDGWVNYGGGKFYVEDDCIVAESIDGLPNTFLHTEKKYQDFVLEFDVKLDTVLNSGVQIRSNIYEKKTTTIRWGGKFDEDGNKSTIERKWPAGRFWGYQIEIDPTSRAWSGALYEEGGRGFLHTPGVNETVKAAFKPLEWNHFKVHVKGDHIQSWINDVMIADVYDDLTADGFIALQLHGIGKNTLKKNKKIRWKNLTIIPL
tara:strand:- start:5388 stop:6083 length:696 start_codon:yes stop_codon:yes gene_type:complete